MIPPPNPRSLLRQNGSARNARVRDYEVSHSTSFFTSETCADYEEPHSHSTRSSGTWNAETGNGPDHSSYSYARWISDSDLDFPRRTSPPAQQFYQGVPRSRKEAYDSHVHQASGSRDVGHSTNRNTFHGMNSRRQSHASTRQLHPVGCERQDLYGGSYYANSRPLGKSNLSDLVQNRPPMKNIDRRMLQDSRDDPYDAVGYVGRRSDYDKRSEYEQHHQEERFLDDEEIWGNGDGSGAHY